MESFLLLISFLLHMITLAAIFGLVQKLKAIKNEPKTKDVVAVLERSLREIKEENNRLQAILNKEMVQPPIREGQPEIKESSAREKTLVKEENTSQQIGHLIGDDLGYKIEASLESKVLQLHAKGMTVEEIAKRLDCGKTEAELIIKLYNK